MSANSRIVGLSAPVAFTTPNVDTGAVFALDIQRTMLA